MGLKKLNLSNKELVREKIFNGVNKAVDLVSMTLGPAGQSIIIQNQTDEPLIVDDGRRAMENIKLDDPVEHLAVRTLYEVTRKTDEKVGDGTTTSAVLARAIMKEISDKHLAFGGLLTNSADVNEIDKKIQKAKNEILEFLDKEKKEVTTKKELIDVATVSVGDEKLGKIIGEIYWELGKDGHIALEFNLTSEETETETVPGYRFTGSYADTFMITNEIRKISQMKDVHVLTTFADRENITLDQIKPIASEVQHNGKHAFVIIARKFTTDFLKTVYLTAMKSKFNILCVRAPSLHQEQFKDIAIWTGGKYFSEKDDLSTATLSDLGFVSDIEVYDELTAQVVMVNGKGDKKKIKERIAEVEGEMKQMRVHALKQSRLDRISALAGGVGVIKIGAPTDKERNWVKHKIEDAKWATKVAFREGIVKGGGMTFKKISEKLPEDNILKTALLAPYNQLKANSGGDFTVGKDVFDPVGVEKTALDIACSAVSKLIRVGGAIVFKPKTDFEDSLKNILGVVQEDEESEVEEN